MLTSRSALTPSSTSSAKNAASGAACRRARSASVSAAHRQSAFAHPNLSGEAQRERRQGDEPGGLECEEQQRRDERLAADEGEVEAEIEAGEQQLVDVHDERGRDAVEGDRRAPPRV